MKHRLFTFASALSLLLLVASLVLWGASESRGLIVTRVAWPRSYFGIRCVGGRALIWIVSQPMSDRPPGWQFRTDLPRQVLSSRIQLSDRELAADEASSLYQQFSGRGSWHGAGFGFEHTRDIADDGLPYRDLSLILPIWALAAVSALLPLAAATAILRTRSRAKASLGGLCPTCDYDLRASSERCPECGTLIPAKARE